MPISDYIPDDVKDLGDYLLGREKNIKKRQDEDRAKRVKANQAELAKQVQTTKAENQTVIQKVEEKKDPTFKGMVKGRYNRINQIMQENK